MIKRKNKDRSVRKRVLQSSLAALLFFAVGFFGMIGNWFPKNYKMLQQQLNEDILQSANRYLSEIFEKVYEEYAAIQASDEIMQNVKYIYDYGKDFAEKQSPAQIDFVKAKDSLYKDAVQRCFLAGNSISQIVYLTDGHVVLSGQDTDRMQLENHAAMEACLAAFDAAEILFLSTEDIPEYHSERTDYIISFPLFYEQTIPGRVCFFLDREKEDTFFGKDGENELLLLDSKDRILYGSAKIRQNAQVHLKFNDEEKQQVIKIK